LHQNWLIRFQNIVFTSLEKDKWMDGWMDERTDISRT